MSARAGKDSRMTRPMITEPMPEPKPLITDRRQRKTREAIYRAFTDLLKEKTHDFSHDYNMRARATHVLYHLQEHLGDLAGILSGESDAVFMDYFKEKLTGLFAPSIPKDSAVPRGYLLNHMVCDFSETVRWWTKHSRYSPEEISGFLFTAMPGQKE